MNLIGITYHIIVAYNMPSSGTQAQYLTLPFNPVNHSLKTSRALHSRHNKLLISYDALWGLLMTIISNLPSMCMLHRSQEGV